jgi:Homeobox KN domain
VLTPTDDIRFHSGSFYATGSNGSHYQRKRRGNLPKDATKVLRQWFDDHLQAPYPGEEVKNELCNRTGLQISQVRLSVNSKLLNEYLRPPTRANMVCLVGQQLVH